MKGSALVGAGIAGSALWIAILVPLWGALGPWVLAIPGVLFIFLLAFGVASDVRRARRGRARRGNRALSRHAERGTTAGLVSPRVPQPAEQ